MADCILLFGYGKGDVFPVDTWIKKMYNKYYDNIDNREKIRNNLTSQFGDLSGYAQQYLFNFMRANWLYNFIKLKYLLKFVESCAIIIIN